MRELRAAVIFLFIHSAVSAGPLEVSSQEWDYHYFQEVQYAGASDFSSQLDAYSEGWALEFANHDWNYEGGWEAFSSTDGVSFIEYTTSVQDSGGTVTMHAGDYDSMLEFDFQLHSDHTHFASGSGASYDLNCISNGSIDFEILEPATLILRLELNAESFSNAAGDASMSALSVTISSADSQAHLNVSVPLGGDGVAFGDLIAEKTLKLLPSVYTAELGVSFRVEGSGGGVIFSEGSSQYRMTLYAQSDAMPELPIHLGITKGADEDTLTFSTDNMRIGKGYELEASPDLSFSDPTVAGYFDRKVLYPEMSVNIGGYGPQQFFRLVEGD